MNIFVTSYDPARSAYNLDDKRVVKMVLESAQLLSTALHFVGAPDPPYRKTHSNHPCSIWTREAKPNYTWLLNHMEALCREYTARYDKTHKCEAFIPAFREYSLYLPDTDSTPHPNCSLYKEVADVRLAYAWTLLQKWANDKRKPTWYGKHERPF